MVWIMFSRQKAGITGNDTKNRVSNKKTIERHRTSIVHCHFIMEETNGKNNRRNK